MCASYFTVLEFDRKKDGIFLPKFIKNKGHFQLLPSSSKSMLDLAYVDGIREKMGTNRARMP